MLEVADIVKEYRLPGQKPIRVLDGVSFAVKAGEITASLPPCCVAAFTIA